MILKLNNNQYIDTDQPLDISIPLGEGSSNVTAWYCDPPEIEAVRNDQFIGSIAEGGNVNFRNVKFNPHGCGTHTECVGHITEKVYSINDVLKKFWFHAEVISIEPKKIYNDDYECYDTIVTQEQLIDAVQERNSEALIIRTLPNETTKKEKKYSRTNPVYVQPEAMEWLVNNTNVQHFLIDVPSVDREEDAGNLTAHKTFWNVPENPCMEKTITELVYTPNNVKDGQYLLNLQINSLVNDASPSKPVLYSILTFT